MTTNWETVASIDKIQEDNPDWTLEQCREEFERLSKEAIKKVTKKKKDSKPAPKAKTSPKKKPIQKATSKSKAERANPDTGLTDREQEFCRQYIAPTPNAIISKLTDRDIPFNGTRAAVRAGYSEKTAHVKSSQILRKVKAQEYIHKLQKPAFDKFEITQERILQEMASLAFSNIMDFVEVDSETGQAWIDISKCTREEAAALSNFEVSELPPTKVYRGWSRRRERGFAYKDKDVR